MKPREWWIYKTGKLTLASDTMLKNVKARFLGEPPVFVREVLPGEMLDKRKELWDALDALEVAHEIKIHEGARQFLAFELFDRHVASRF
jgi:hypothetical protein